MDGILFSTLWHLLPKNVSFKLSRRKQLSSQKYSYIYFDNKLVTLTTINAKMNKCNFTRGCK